jgi:hypothetical protein
MNGDAYSTAISLAFGYEGDSPWKDERLRQAVSLPSDREMMIDVHANRGHYQAEGLDYPSVITAISRLGRVPDRPSLGAGLRPNARFFTTTRPKPGGC